MILTDARRDLYNHLAAELANDYTIYWTKAPEDAVYPHVVLMRLSAPTNPTLRTFCGEYGYSVRYMLYINSSGAGSSHGSIISGAMDKIHDALTGWYNDGKIIKVRRVAIGPDYIDRIDGQLIYGDSVAYEFWLRAEEEA